jgi:hypothetical protein
MQHWPGRACSIVLNSVLIMLGSFKLPGSCSFQSCLLTCLAAHSTRQAARHPAVMNILVLPALTAGNDPKWDTMNKTGTDGQW